MSNECVMRDSFVFYRSFLEAAQFLPQDLKAEFLTAIIEYALNGTENEQLDSVVKSLMMMAKPQIDKNNVRYENGKKGGRPKTKTEETITEEKPKENQTITEEKPKETKTKPNVNVNVNVNDNVNGIYITSQREVCENSEVSDFTPSPTIPPPKDLVDYEKIVSLYHSICKDYPRVIKLTESRKQKIRIRFIDEMKSDYNLIESIFRKMQDSKFLRGDNKQGWKATFDWVFENGKNWVKIAEGNYDNKSGTTINERNKLINSIWN